jgi:hypothetical protein
MRIGRSTDVRSTPWFTSPVSVIGYVQELFRTKRNW